MSYAATWPKQMISESSTLFVLCRKAADLDLLGDVVEEWGQDEHRLFLALTSRQLRKQADLYLLRDGAPLDWVLAHARGQQARTA